MAWRGNELTNGTYTVLANRQKDTFVHGFLDVSGRVLIAGNLVLGSGGRVGIGSANPGVALDISGSGSLFRLRQTGSGDVALISKPSTSTNYAIRFDNTGGASNANWMAFNNNNSGVGSITSSSTNTTYATTSDYRIKSNIRPLENAEDVISKLRPVRFEFVKYQDITQDGFIAHEVQEIIPWAVSGEKDEVDENGNPKIQGLDNSYMIPYIVKMLQNQHQIIESLQIYNSELKDQIQAILSRLDNANIA